MSVVPYNNVIIGERDALRSDQLRFKIYMYNTYVIFSLCLLATLITVKKMERKFEIATRTLCLRVTSDLF